MLFESWQPDVLTASMDVMRIELPPYSEEHCPPPTPDHPAYACDYQSNSLVHLARTGLEEEHPDIVHLLSRLRYGKEDLEEMLRATGLGKSPSDAACGWLRDNPERWQGWIRQGVQERVEERREQFYEQCFGRWVGVNDRESFTRNAIYLSPRGAGVGAKKVLPGGMHRGSSGAPVPSSEEWREMARSANAGSLRAESNWTRFEPWQYRR
eukprot:gene775-6852_t